MDARLQGSLRRVLAGGGVLGLLLTPFLLIPILAWHVDNDAPAQIAARLPLWSPWGAAPPGALTMLVAGALCALLLVAGKGPVKACAAVAAAWFVIVQALFHPSGAIMQRFGETLDQTVLDVGGLVSVAALLAVSILAIVIAVRPSRASEARLVAGSARHVGHVAGVSD